MNSIIQTPTPNLKESILSYQTLNFSRVDKDGFILFSDGSSIIEINPDRYARAGVKLFKRSWAKELKELESLTSVLKIDNGYQLADASGTWIYLIESKEEPNFNMEGHPPSTLGKNAGLSLESMDISLSLQIWRAIGFINQQGSIDQGWVTITNNDGLIISLMKPNTCPHLFFNPSLTFFNGKENVAIIDKIKSLNMPITEEITHFNKEGKVDNIIIRDPGGLGFFLFSDG